jgi:phospholipase C
MRLQRVLRTAAQTLPVLFGQRRIRYPVSAFPKRIRTDFCGALGNIGNKGMANGYVDLNPPDVLGDIRKCELAAVSWVIPDGKYSDHPINSGQGPTWVTAIVNAIGNSTTCDNNIGYWQDTAIFITWDDRGGWFDHVAPVILKDTRKYQDQ